MRESCEVSTGICGGDILGTYRPWLLVSASWHSTTCYSSVKCLAGDLDWLQGHVEIQTLLRGTGLQSVLWG